MGYNGDNYEISAGDFVVLFTNYRYYLPSPAQDFTRISIRITAHPDDLWLPDTKTPGLPEEFIRIPFYLKTGYNSEILKLCTEAVNDFNSSISGRRNLSYIKVEHLLHELSQLSNLPQNPHGIKIRNLINFLDTHPYENFNLDLLAKKISMSKRTMTQEFKKTCGKSIISYHINQKIRTAINLMKTEPDIRIKEIAYLLKFYDEYAFSKTFKKITGVSPSKFLRSL